MKIADILRHKASAAGRDVPVVTIGPSGTIADAASALAENNIGALLVVEDDKLAGVVSERDIVRHLATSGAAVLERPVADLMTRDVVTCSTSDSIDSIAETMTAKRVRHMPVLDRGELIGIVSIGDVVLSRIRQLEQDRGQLEHYIAG
jgi:CBS domain-containing protein